MAQRSTNTLPELIQKFLADLGQGRMMFSDEEVAKSYEIEQFLLSIAREPVQGQVDQGLLPNDQSMMMQGGMDGMGGMAPSPGMPPTALPSMAPMPNPDELRRLLQG